MFLLSRNEENSGNADDCNQSSESTRIHPAVDSQQVFGLWEEKNQKNLEGSRRSRRILREVGGAGEPADAAQKDHLAGVRIEPTTLLGTKHMFHQYRKHNPSHAFQSGLGFRQIQCEKSELQVAILDY